jgi:hypothetical protein
MAVIPKVLPTTSLGGARGCDFVRNRNQLIFVEGDAGKISRVDMVRSVDALVSSGRAVLHGTCPFDFDAGVEGGGPQWGDDVCWEQHTTIERSMATRVGAKIANIGVVDFKDVSPAELQNLSYSDTPINGNDDATNQLVKGDVFAVITNEGNYAKVKVIKYGYDLEIEWVTYRLEPRYSELGAHYNQPQDVVVSADGRHAYITEDSGDLLYVDLANADRDYAKVVSSGMAAPRQIALDEKRGHAYIVEAGRGTLLRIDLKTGAQTELVSNLEDPIGLLMADDLRFAYVGEHGVGRVSRIELSTGQREVLVKGMTSPYFMTWADAGEGAILVAERHPANRVSLINLTKMPVSVWHLPTEHPLENPSSVAVTVANHLLVCNDSWVGELNFSELVYGATGPILLGIGHVPFDRIFNGYADTTGDPDYFFQVKDAPFGGTLSLMINHERAFEKARYYKVLVDQKEQRQSWSDYRWDSNENRFALRTISPQDDGYYDVRRPGEVWYNHWLGYRLNTSGLSNGLHTISVKLFDSNHSEIGTDSDPGRSVQVQTDNSWPTAVIDQILHDGNPVETCGIVDSGSNEFTFRITAHDPEGHLQSWHLGTLWGDNKSAAVKSDSYTPTSNRQWHGIRDEVVPVPAWPCTVPGDPTSKRCAHTFYLTVWDRVIDGYNHIHRSSYHKSITIMLP